MWPFKRKQEEKRGEFPWAPAREYLAALGYPATSYADIDATRFETSLQSVAVRSSVDLLASLASELPKHVYRGQGASRTQVKMPGNLEDPGADGHGLADWCYQVMLSWLSRGNCFGEILDRTANNTLGHVLLINPAEISGRLEQGEIRWQVNGEDIASERILHRRVNPVPGRIMGLSPLEFHASTVGTSLTATQFGLQWFKDGAHPSALFTNSEEEIDKDKADAIKARFLAALGRGREPLVYGRGWDYKAIQVTAEESQFLATQGFTEAQCARIFGPGVAEILGYESGGNLTYTNVESRFAHLLVATLDKWLCRLERLLNEFLPRPQYVRIDRDALLQTTTAERYLVHERALKNWWKTINEVRGDEDLPPVPWGDEPYYTNKSFAEAYTVSESTSTSTTIESQGGDGGQGQ